MVSKKRRRILLKNIDRLLISSKRVVGAFGDLEIFILQIDGLFKFTRRRFGCVTSVLFKEIYFDIVHEYKFDSKFMKTLFAVAAINLQLKIVAK